MKKKIVVVVILIIVVVVCLMLKKDIYVVEIPNADSVTKIVYQASLGDVYEVKDKDAINEFIKSIDKMEFKEKKSLKHTSWTSSLVELYNDSDECIWSIQSMGENGIVVGWDKYESEAAYNLSVLTEKGVFIKNIHEE